MAHLSPTGRWTSVPISNPVDQTSHLCRGAAPSGLSLSSWLFLRMLTLVVQSINFAGWSSLGRFGGGGIIFPFPKYRFNEALQDVRGFQSNKSKTCVKNRNIQPYILLKVFMSYLICFQLSSAWLHLISVTYQTHLPEAYFKVTQSSQHTHTCWTHVFFSHPLKKEEEKHPVNAKSSAL